MRRVSMEEEKSPVVPWGHPARRRARRPHRVVLGVGLSALTVLLAPGRGPAGAAPPVNAGVREALPTAPARAETSLPRRLTLEQFAGRGASGARGPLPASLSRTPSYRLAHPGPASSTRSSSAVASPLVSVSYSLVQESDGNRPRSGSQVFLLFGAADQAFIYASDASQAVADAATYSFSAGRLSLRVATADLKIGTTFPLDLSAARVSMPFQIFSSKPGTSLWQRQPIGLDQGALAIYNAAMNTGSSVTNAAAAGQAFSYAQAWVATQGLAASATSERPARRAGLPRLAGLPRRGAARPAAGLARRGPDRYAAGGTLARRPAAGARVGCGSHCVAGVTNLGDDILVTYRNAPPVVVSLYNSAPACSVGGCTSLTLSGLSSDPRVFLDPTVHPDHQFNPLNKTAVFIAPVADIEDPAALTDMATALSQRGYKVKQLIGADASILAIANLLRASPGYVLFSTHGNTAGQLLTGQSLSTEGFFSAAKDAAAYQELKTELTSDGLGTLGTYKAGGSAAYYVGEPNCSLKVAFFASGKSCSWKVVVTPAFWDWLRAKHGANFSHSLVFISACETDTTPLLRDAVKARAYFAFSQDVASNFATAVERYLAEALWRPTHSTEEAFYNLLRVEKTHQMIYKEDRLLQGVMGAPGSDASPDIMDGWGWDGSTMVEYRGSGWLSGKVDPGQVWWMLYTARWSKNTADGATGLQTCYAKYWSHGNPGGLASPYCNAANAGIPKDPTSLQTDVAYAIYLLKGTPPAGFSANQLPPRLTLAD